MCVNVSGKRMKREKIAWVIAECENYERFKRFAQLNLHNNSSQAWKALYFQMAIKSEIVHATKSLQSILCLHNDCEQLSSRLSAGNFCYWHQWMLTYGSNDSQREQKCSRKFPLIRSLFDRTFSVSIDNCYLIVV